MKENYGLRPEDLQEWRGKFNSLDFETDNILFRTIPKETLKELKNKDDFDGFMKLVGQVSAGMAGKILDGIMLQHFAKVIARVQNTTEYKEYTPQTKEAIIGFYREGFHDGIRAK